MTPSKQDEFDFNIGINAFYSGEFKSGLRSTEKLLHKNTGWKVENNVRCNQTYYLPKISDHSGVQVFKISVPFLGDNFSSFNPTIIKWREKILVLVRHSNYVIVNGRYIINDPKRIIHTKYSACIYDIDLCLTEIRFLENEYYEKSQFPADGIEDIRLYYEGTQLMGSGTIRNLMPYYDKAKIAKVKIDLDNNRVSVPEILSSPYPGERHEKNWMPILGSNPIKWLYSCGENGRTTLIAETNNTTYVCSENPAPEISRNFRGGSQLVTLQDGNLLCIIHEVCIFSNGVRNYVHRFVLFNNECQLLDYSLPFFLSNDRTIEFVAGLCLNNDDILITYGYMDKEAYIMKISLENVIKMINYRKEFMHEDRRIRYF